MVTFALAAVAYAVLPDSLISPLVIAIITVSGMSDPSSPLPWRT
jgi:hypothetical protein